MRKSLWTLKISLFPFCTLAILHDGSMSKNWNRTHSAVTPLPPADNKIDASFSHKNIIINIPQMKLTMSSNFSRIERFTEWLYLKNRPTTQDEELIALNKFAFTLTNLVIVPKFQNPSSLARIAPRSLSLATSLAQPSAARPQLLNPRETPFSICPAPSSNILVVLFFFFFIFFRSQEIKNMLLFISIKFSYLVNIPFFFSSLLQKYIQLVISFFFF